MTDFFGARETSGKAVMLGSAEQNRCKGKADWSICLGQFLYKVKRERECCLIHQVGNLGLKTDALSRNKAFAFALPIKSEMWPGLGGMRHPSNGYIYFKVYIKKRKDTQKDIQLYRFRLY